MISRLTKIRYKRLEIIARASHLFEQQDELIEVGILASSWFRKFMA
jgi:hypothetical protein